jgi:hypothetical protein
LQFAHAEAAPAKSTNKLQAMRRKRFMLAAQKLPYAECFSRGLLDGVAINLSPSDRLDY